MLILGRSPNLVLGLLTAVFNVAVTYHIGGFSPTVDQIGVTNIAFGALIALIANTGSIQAAAGEAAKARARG